MATCDNVLLSVLVSTEIAIAMLDSAGLGGSRCNHLGSMKLSATVAFASALMVLAGFNWVV